MRAKKVYLLVCTTNEDEDNDDSQVVGIFSSKFKAKKAVKSIMINKEKLKKNMSLSISTDWINKTDWTTGFFLVPYA